MRETEQQMVNDVLSEVDVICSTCAGCGMETLQGRNFPVVIIDEATQATEPAALCALVKGSEHVILLGDHFQLPPTITSPRASAGGLGESLFQRLVSLGVSSYMLETQYRMHPAISDFPSIEFYKGKLLDGITAEVREPSSDFEWPDRTHPIAFVPLATSQEAAIYHNLSESKVNKDEAEVVVGIVKQLISGGHVTPKQIGVITPYSGQMALLMEMFERAGGTKKGQPYHKLTVHTVDGFQGREKDIIIFSTVRANAQGRVGFLNDWRRLNVALTRARTGLIVVGHEPTLVTDEHWKRWVDYVKSKNLVYASKTLVYASKNLVTPTSPTNIPKEK